MGKNNGVNRHRALVKMKWVTKQGDFIKLVGPPCKVEGAPTVAAKCGMTIDQFHKLLSDNGQVSVPAIETALKVLEDPTCLSKEVEDNVLLQQNIDNMNRIYDKKAQLSRDHYERLK